MRSKKGNQGLAFLLASACMLLMPAAGGAGASQIDAGAIQSSAPSLQFPASPPPPDEPMQQKAMHDQLAKRNTVRQQELVADTNKLLRLATELKAEVDKSNKDTLSITVIKKSEEIEKLAKSVKDKMKNPI